MQSPADILNDIWTSAGGEPAALVRVRLTGEEPQTHFFAFGAADVLQLAEAHLHARRTVRGIERVGGRRAGSHAALDQGFGDAASLFG